MLWQKSIPHELCRYIYLKDNYLIITQLQITFQKANAILKDFIRNNNKHLDLLKKFQQKMQTSISIFTLHCIRNLIHGTTNLALKIGRCLICVTGNILIVRTTNPQLRLLLLATLLLLLLPQLKQKPQKI